MKKQVKKLVKWIKKQDIRGCITGSVMLGYFDGQDIDVFCYDENGFKKTLAQLEANPKFQIVNPLEKWKFDTEFGPFKSKNNFGITTIKFIYNNCLELNVIYKKDNNNIFAVLSTFDMDIIAKGYDIQTKKILDLSENLPNKQVSWNKWNTAYYSPDLWKMSRILRQLERCFKYHKRGYNTDLVVKKFIDIIEQIQNYQNIFNSENFSETLKIKKENTKIIKKICIKWLKTHKITDDEIKLLRNKYKEI